VGGGQKWGGAMTQVCSTYEGKKELGLKGKIAGVNDTTSIASQGVLAIRKSVEHRQTRHGCWVMLLLESRGKEKKREENKKGKGKEKKKKGKGSKKMKPNARERTKHWSGGLHLQLE